MNTYVTVYFGTVLLTMFLVPIVSRLAKKYRVVDNPGPRKVHTAPLPRIGGITFAISSLTFIIAVFFLNNNIGQAFRQSHTKFITLLVGAGFIFTVGLIDDLRDLKGSTKLLCLVIASIAICASGSTLDSISLGSWFEFETGWTAWPLTIIWITMITVCIGFIDGLDGLAAGIAAIVCSTMVCLALWSNEAAMAVLMLALLGSVTGFLFFNFYPAKIFMGDCGSMFLGFMIGAGSIIYQNKTSTVISLAIPFLVLGAPIFDTGLVIVSRRILERRSIFSPDNNHLHHRLLKLGLHHRAAVIVIYAITAICASLGLLILNIEGNWSFALLTGILLVLFTILASLHSGRFSKITQALKRNLAIAKETNLKKRCFETAQVKMYESRTFETWWDTVCSMAQKMQFESIELWKCDNGQFTNTLSWKNSEVKSHTNRILKVSFPISSKGTTDWEIKTGILIEKYLELSGQQATFLGRLIDEFPPPSRREISEIERLSLYRVNKLKEREISLVKKLQKETNIPDTLKVMGIPVVPFESYDQALSIAEEIIKGDNKSLWIAINPIKIYHAWHNPKLHDLLTQIDIGICDGIGVSIASKILNGVSINRCTGCDLFFKLLSLADRRKWSIFMLGATEQSNTAARNKISRLYPNLKIAGWQDGYFKDSSEVVTKINSSGAKLLFVAMGSPKQEFWMWENRHELKANVCMGVGGSFNIAAGNLKRAPKIFRATGSEFLYRLMREPHKRWSIQKSLFPYLCRIIGKKAVDLTLSEEGSEEFAKKEL